MLTCKRIYSVIHSSTICLLILYNYTPQTQFSKPRFCEIGVWQPRSLNRDSGVHGLFWIIHGFSNLRNLSLSFYFQIYILIRDPRITLHLEENPNSEKDLIKESILVISILSSLCSLAWSLVVYHRSLRYSLAEKNNLNATGSILQFLWHLSSITARVIGKFIIKNYYFFRENHN